MAIKLFNINSDPNLHLIDQQHSQFIEVIDAFSNSTMSGGGLNGIKNTLEFLKEYSVTHFQTEEGIMDLIAYPEKDYHISEHNSFKEFIELVPDSYPVYGKDSCLDMLLYLRSWLVAHIRHTDANLIEYYLQSYIK